MRDKIHETLVLAMDHDMIITSKPFGISEENSRESQKIIEFELFVQHRDIHNLPFGTFEIFNDGAGGGSFQPGVDA